MYREEGGRRFLLLLQRIDCQVAVQSPIPLLAQENQIGEQHIAWWSIESRDL